jgi:transketolase
VLADSASLPQVVLIATGSEVALALEAQKSLADEGIGARVVSLPCTSVFDRQDADWRAQVLPPGVPRVAVEAGQPDYWRKYVGLEGASLGIASFGESAPAGKLYAHFGLTAPAIAAAARRAIGR